jgi:hypothetical protein
MKDFSYNWRDVKPGEGGTSSGIGCLTFDHKRWSCIVGTLPMFFDERFYLVLGVESPPIRWWHVVTGRSRAYGKLERSRRKRGAHGQLQLGRYSLAKTQRR